MSENSNSFYQIPNGEYDQSINNEIDVIYDTQNIVRPIENDISISMSVENEPIVNRLKMISNQIARARAEHLTSQDSRHSINQGNFIRGVSKQLFNRSLSSNRRLTENDLKTKESTIGAGVFGSIREGERREFFNDNGDWFFHQDIINDSTGNRSSRTLHYEVLPEGVLLVGRGMIHGEELTKFAQATEMYYQRVMSQLYLKNVSYTGGQLAA